MRFELILTLACTLALGVTPALAKSGACKDDKGKFIKCAAAAPAAKPTTEKCKDAKGKFIKCAATPAATTMTPPATPAAKPAAAPAAAPAPAPAVAPAATVKPATAAKAANTDPAGATGKCKDGTYTHSKTHSGACSHHGGVASWIN